MPTDKARPPGDDPPPARRRQVVAKPDLDLGAPEHRTAGGCIDLSEQSTADDGERPRHSGDYEAGQ